MLFVKLRGTDGSPIQLVLLNGGSLIGRLCAGFIAPYIGVGRTIIISVAMCGILILGMIGMANIPSVVVIGTIYGYFAGVCQFSSLFQCLTVEPNHLADIATLSPLIALLTSNLSELGFVAPHALLQAYTYVRLASAWALASLSPASALSLVGPPSSHMIAYPPFMFKGGPISGALLTSQYKWWQPGLFSGVRNHECMQRSELTRLNSSSRCWDVCFWC